LKTIGDMSAEELAGLVCQTLKDAGVTVTLTGGACVAIWSQGKYVSKDLDFIEEGPVPRRKIRDALKLLGFREEGRYFVHPATKFFIEFPTGPLMVGGQRIEHVTERTTLCGDLRLLSPTDCVKDRLAAFFHWNDRQSLEQALMVAQAQHVDLEDVRRWSKSEGNDAKFGIFEQKLSGHAPIGKPVTPQRPPNTSAKAPGTGKEPGYG
jgi:hypothetical protein